MEALLTELAKHGLPSLMLGIALAWIYRQHVDYKELQEKYKADLKEVQDKRIEDAKMVTDKLMEINDKWNTVVSDHARTMEVMDPTLKEIKTILLNAHMERSSGRK